MSGEDLIRKFVGEIKLRAFKDKFVDHDEEMAILKIAIDAGVELEAARRVLIEVCNDEGFGLDSLIDQKAEEMLSQFANNDGRVDQKEFNDVVDIMLNTSHNVLTRTRCASKAKAIMVAREWQAREGTFKGGKWFSSID